ncbi:DsbA family protein [Ostreiculturibacter nitratireducens]|uniref:DsbA family protein n=1 Tax=Ostreiculturibacter nitratireducens TaxID=3075226 RepID=UPI0031B5A10B
MSNKLALAALAIAAVAGGAWWTTRGAEPYPALSMAAVAQEAVTDEQLAMVPDMVIGQADAPVTIIEYASFTCPHCKNFHDTVFEQLKADYIDTGKVRFVYREVYFDRYGLWAGMIARCGGEMRYFGITDMIYDTQKDWIGDGEPATVAENLRKIGLKAGLSKDQIEVCLNDQTMAEAMVATYQKNATEHGVNGTPSFVIEGTTYSNMSYEEMKKILDEKLAN